MSGPGALFTYGTLMFAPVLRAVCGASLPARPARLAGHARYCVQGASYPAIVPAAADVTLDGVLYANVTPALWRQLDAYEGALYRRVEVTVRLADGTDVAACTYVVAPGQEHRLSDRPWRPTEFAARHLDDYLAQL